MDFGFSSDVERNLQNIRSSITFDMMVFTNTQDYLCYVEAVHQLQHENIKRTCDFLLDPDVFKDSIYNLNITDRQFLTNTNRAQEYFFVIDNTDYPEAVLQPDWQPSPQTGDGSEDLFINMEVRSTFTSNNKYFFWTWIFSLIVILLGGLLVLSLICYCRQSYVYNRYTKERRALKKELIKIKDTEYTNFLL